MTHDVSTAEWVRIKALWPAYEQASPEERRQLSQGLSQEARALLDAMLAVDDQPDGLDGTAFGWLGLVPLTPERDSGVPSLVGRRLGPWRLLREVGRGGMGAVYEAMREDDQFTQRVAIKSLWRGADSAVLLQRFRSERQILASLQHPNIAQLVDGGATDEGTPWIALEYVEGTPIDVWCDERQLSIRARLDLFRQVCAAVHHAHQRLVVHRDLKPSNVLVTNDGLVKLLDFGVAKLIDPVSRDGTLTGAGLSPFTAAWAAPEQLEGGTVTTAADVYALGGLLTVLLAGQPPRAVEESTPGSAERLMRTPVRLPSTIAARGGDAAARVRGLSSASRLAAELTGELDAIAGLAMRDEPDRRYESVAALSDDVHRYLRRDRVLARPDNLLYRVWSTIRRRPVIAGAVAMALLSIVIGGGVAWWQALSARVEARRADRVTRFLSGLVTGTGAMSFDPFVRVSPSATVAQLLDSAVARIPREFADDPRSRARLYGAIGNSLYNQGRRENALRVLDSARVLAEQGYGDGSLELARALIDYETVVLALRGPREARTILERAEHVVGAHREEQELRWRVQVARVGYEAAVGRIVRSDSIAAAVLAELPVAARGSLALRAQNARMFASSWISRDPRVYLRLARAVEALADSLHLGGTPEHIAATVAEFEALSVLGRGPEASAVLDRLRQLANQIGLVDDIGDGLLEYLERFLAGVDGDTARRHASVERGLEATESKGLGWNTMFPIYTAWLQDRVAAADPAAAEVARRMITRLEPSGANLALGLGYWWLAQAERVAGHYDAALRASRDGRRWIDSTPDLVSVRPLLQREEWQALRLLGRVAESDSVKRTLATREPRARCTPGGDWRGCPDIP
jgi:serine/threonine-protein kinase